MTSEVIYLKDGTSTEHWGYVFKIGKMAFFTMTVPGHKTISANSIVVVANLPTGFYPDRETTIGVSCTLNINLLGYMRNNGEIVVYNPSNSSINNWRAFGVFRIS